MEDMKHRLRSSFLFLGNPDKSFKGTQDLDGLLGNYLMLLLLTSFAAGLFTCAFALVRGTYYDLFLNADTHYYGLINYAVGQAISVFFLYLFSGTVIVFVIASAISIILNRSLVTVIKIMLQSLSPALLFGWIPLIIPGILVWSSYYFIHGMNIARSRHR